MSTQISILTDIEKLSDSRPPETITWNPWHGCHKVSAGCDNCYMFARDLSYGKDPRLQCVEAGVAFSYHQTGAKLRKGGKIYNIPRELQEVQAKKAGLDFDGEKMVGWD